MEVTKEKIVPLIFIFPRSALPITRTVELSKIKTSLDYSDLQ